MACCESSPPVERQAPPAPQRTDDQGQKLAHTLTFDCYPKSCSPSTQYLNDSSRSAHLFTVSLVELSVRLNT